MQLTNDHIHHALELLKDEGDRPTFQRPNRIIVCYNIYDCLASLRISLASISEKVDGAIFVYGPYRLVFDPTGLMSEKEIKAEEDKHIRLIEHYFPKENFSFIRKDVWESEIEKRNAYLQSDFLRDGDYLLILDDDELFMSISDASLKTTIAWANRKSFTIGWRHAKSTDIGLNVHNPEDFVIPILQRGFRRAPDAIAMMRLFRFDKNLAYHTNHFTIVDMSMRDDKGRPQLIIPEAMMWNMSIMHVEDMKDPNRIRKKRQYYLQRNYYELEGERDSDQSREV